MEAGKGATRQNNSIVPEYEEDLWAFVDPHSARGSKNRPIKMGKTFTLPPGLSEDGEEEDVNASVSMNTSTSINKSSFVVEDEELSLKGLAYGKEFAYVAEGIKRRKAAKKRKNRGGNWYGRGKRKEVAVEEEDNQFEIANEEEDGFAFGMNDEEEEPQEKGPQNVDTDQFEDMFGTSRVKNEEEDKRYGSNPMDETR